MFLVFLLFLVFFLKKKQKRKNMYIFIDKNVIKTLKTKNKNVTNIKMLLSLVTQ